MCGRFSQGAEAESLLASFGLESGGPAWERRYNLASGQDIIVLFQEGWRHRLALMRWGLVLLWAASPDQGYKMTSALGETLASKPAFRGALRSRRCLVPADGFYEWRAPVRRSAPRQPLRFAFAEEGLFAMAGLWERWRSLQGGELLSFSIITVAASSLASPIRDRMPALLLTAQEAAWLDPAQDNPASLPAPLPLRS